MSETEGFPPEQEAAAPPEFTPEQLAAARAQLLAQGDDLGQAAGVAPDSASLGIHALAEGAQADQVDPVQLLASIQALQAKVDALEREKKLSQAPDVVKYAQAVHDYIAAKQAAHPVINADPDHSFAPAVGLAAAAVGSAESSVDSGDPGSLPAQLAGLKTWVQRHARRFPQLDYSALLDVLDEADAAAAKLAA